MGLRMTTATTRRDSSLKQIRKRVPDDVVARAGPLLPDHITSLRADAGGRGRGHDQTRYQTVPAGARSESCKDANWGGDLPADRIFASVRAGPVELDHQQTIALSGQVYRLICAPAEAVVRPRSCGAGF